MRYNEDRQWSDQFIGEIKRIVAPLLLEPASFEVDATEATDLIVLKARDMRIAARVRGTSYLKKFGDQFTIRSALPSGTRTELQKVVMGFGDLFFYGFGDSAAEGFSKWTVFSLDAFRLHYADRTQNGLEFGAIKNNDNTVFTWFKTETFPDEPAIVTDTSDKHLGEAGPHWPEIPSMYEPKTGLHCAETHCESLPRFRTVSEQRGGLVFVCGAGHQTIVAGIDVDGVPRVVVNAKEQAYY